MTPTEERAWQFATAEFHQIHAVCDVAEIPRTTADGAKFSAAQRVRILATVMEGARNAIAKAANRDRPSH